MQTNKSPWHQCLMLINLATWETEIGRNLVQRQCSPGVHETPSQPLAKHGSIYLSSQDMWKTEI
jgi:hypothetical protein